MLEIVNYHDNAQLNLINHTIQVYLKTCSAIYYHVLLRLLKLHFKEHLSMSVQVYPFNKCTEAQRY